MVVPIRKQVHDIENQLNDVEKSVELIAKHVKNQLSEMKKRVEEKGEKGETSETAEGTETAKRIDDIEASVKTITAHVKNQLNSAKQEMHNVYQKDLDEIKNKLRAASPDSRIHSLEAKLSEQVHRLEGYIQDTSKVASDEVKQELRDELTRLEDLFYSSEKMLTEQGMGHYVEKLNKIKQNMERYVNVKMQLTETRMNELSDSIKGMKDSVMLDVDEKIAEQAKEMSKKFSGFETVEDFARFRERIEKHISAEDIEIEDTRKEIEKNMKKVLQKVEEEAEEFRKTLNSKEIHAIRKDISEIRKEMETEKAEKLSMQKEVDDLQHTIASSNLKEELESLRKRMEEESALKLSLQKEMDDFQQMVADMKKKYSALKGVEHMDFEKLQDEIESFREKVKHAEQDSHMKTMNLITQQLEEFSKSMDKRIPEIVTQSQLQEHLGHMRKKMKNIQSPDLTPLALRVEKLEHDVERVVRMMEEMYNRLPVVVE